MTGNTVSLRTLLKSTQIPRFHWLKNCQN
jgi:hypothetical protein